MSAQPDVHPRRLASRWVIHVCPGCNGLVGEVTQTHLGDCEYKGKIFAPRIVPVAPAAGDSWK